MACAKCSAAVKKRIAKLEGVENVTVDHEKGKAVITMKDGKATDKAAIEKALEDTEFKVTAFAKSEAPKVEKKEEKKDEKKEGGAESGKK
jgi:copper chaperone CopZ